MGVSDIPFWLEDPDVETSTRRERRRGRKVNEIMTLTAKVVAEQGYHSTNLEDIADRLDLSKASIYHYFDGKEPLVRATLEACAAYVSLQLQETAKLPGNAPERLARLIRRQLEIITTESVETSRLFLQPLDWPETIGEAVRTWQREHSSIFRVVIIQGIDSGEFDCSDERVALMAIEGAMNLVPTWFTQSSDLAAAEQLIDDVVASLMRLVGVPMESLLGSGPADRAS